MAYIIVYRAVSLEQKKLLILALIFFLRNSFKSIYQLDCLFGLCIIILMLSNFLYVQINFCERFFGRKAIPAADYVTLV